MQCDDVTFIAVCQAAQVEGAGRLTRETEIGLNLSWDSAHALMNSL